jgi:hypothetical protein
MKRIDHGANAEGVNVYTVALGEAPCDGFVADFGEGVPFADESTYLLDISTPASSKGNDWKKAMEVLRIWD